MKTKYLKSLLGSVALATILSACGGAGSCASCASPTPTPGELTLSIAAPTQYPAGVAVTAYLTMTNTSNVNGTNLVYTVPSASNYTGVTITTDANGAGQNCANIAAGASCTFTASIPAGSNPGSFTVLATPNGSATQSVKTATGKSLQADSISVTANLGLVNTPNTSTPYYVLPSDQVVKFESGAATTVYVSVWVKQAGENLSSMSLVDEAGVALTYTALGTPSYSVNSVNTYKVTISAGKSIQHILAQSNVCTSDCSNNALVNLAPVGTGILAIQPNYFQMSESYTTQVVTLQNIGNGVINGLTMPTVTAPFSIESNTCSSTLAANASCTLKVVYTAATASGEGSFIVNYNNGTQVVNTSATIPYSGKSNNPFAILTLSPSSFSLSESHPLQRITVQNTGTAAATSLVLPTLTAPLQESTTTSTCTANQQLEVNASCSYDVYINYNQIVTAGSEAVTFGYNNGQQNQTSSAAADWTALNGAILQITPQSSSFGNVANNNSESSIRVFKVKNSGDVVATELNFYDTPDTNDLYAVITTPPSDTPVPWCDTSYGANPSLSPNSSCYYAIKFGPVPSAIPLGVESDTAVVDYKSLGQNKSVSESLTATVIAASCSSCRIFVTPTLDNGGDLVTGANSSPVNVSPVVTNGYAGGDAICQYYAESYSYTGTYKAMIAGTNRVPGGSDWVLQANVLYTKADGTTTVATSTESAILPSPLTNAIETFPNPIFTGFQNNANPWSADSTQNCQNWTSSANSDHSTYGDAGTLALNAYVNYGAMIFQAYLVSSNGVASVCNNPSARLYCVQQDVAAYSAKFSLVTSTGQANVATNGFTSGNGSQAAPYLLPANTNGTISYTLTNTGNGIARNVSIVSPVLGGTFDAINSTCAYSPSSVALWPGQSCTAKFIINQSAGSRNGVNSFGMIYTDAVYASPHYQLVNAGGETNITIVTGS